VKIQTILEPLREDLRRVERRLREAPMVEEHAVLTEAIDHLFSSGGKRLRPALVLLVSRFYQAASERTIALAAAVEMLHTATLVHDDLIDGSLMRRGSPTLNARWSPGATVLTGDYLFARAAHLAAQTQSVRVMDIFAHTLMIICTGELRQLFDRSEATLVREAYYRRIYAKTASLFALSTEAAAVLGGAPEDEIAAMREYGHQLGMAFQIVDDILDFVGDERTMGKPAGSDLRQGVITLPTLYYLEWHPEDPIVGSVLNGHRDAETVAQAVQRIRESGAVEAAREEARAFAQRSRQALRAFPDEPPRQALWGLADFVVERSL